MRLVSLTCSNTEIVASLGMADRLVGVDDHSDWPAEALAGARRVGPDLTIDLDAVEALRPDLVLASLTVPGHERVVEGLIARGIPHVAPAPTALAHIPRDVRDLARLLGVPDRGEQVAAALEAAFTATPPDPDPPAVLVEWWPRPVFVPGAQSWITQLTELAGGRNPFADRDVPSLAVTPEEVVAAGPEAVVIAWCGVPEARYRPDVVRRRPGWERVPAVRAGRIVPVAEAWLGRPGPRIVRGLEALRSVVADALAGRRL